ncbi:MULTISPECIES: ArsR/SmtB family transcription factor [Streptomyces]|uniref:ArsR/SmtB family transcription factor n=1 Tax=Streptomyces TaxID=1883 RepID=UPI0022506A32|nr:MULTISPECIES: transcriptional regulator [unclassified Streptomyces]WTB51784.1 winged helix-turn-helix domain-containing protein [Streptomyces sp. NBC_00826]WTH95324.1 winged helix-turn-helix domain-containing protein [Streptomyces sp. NBC_00825]WTI04058.1 winged helix-turn-helix domain-containing protein [Streptomyces sp. NBC_00822]MCX4869657.1 winged helix-turn-helix domain-containing protein [Streptomyces sp. NBC_00906]MCX4902612.1 winged helix-turn-helix domain-containing protein [Strept
MLRINFTSEDLVRTRVASTWGPLGETFFSLMTLQQPGCRALFGGWRQSVHAESDACRHPASALFREAFLDLFTVTGASASIEEGLEALRAARPDYLDAELVGAVQARAHYSRCTGPWAGTAWGDIAHDRADRKELLAYLQDSHRAAVAPYWPRILSRLRAEQASHARTLAEHGVEAMLAGLPPGFRWQSPTLEIGRGALTGTVELAGRGLLLVPSAFCQTRPITYTSPADDQAPVVLFIPVIRSISDAATLLTTRETGSVKALSALLGRTRAHTLEAISEGSCTTGQLAVRISASLPTASEQATVLRQAGLIATTRHGSGVLHTLTPLGSALLEGNYSSAQRHDRRG